jgi:hypothetical protein
MNKRGSLKSVFAFDGRRDSYARTNPDYVENSVTRMVREILRLSVIEQATYFEGLPNADRRDITERLRSWPDAGRITLLLDESRRCLDSADSPTGCIAVAGKALDLALVCTNLSLEGTLGRKLHALKKKRTKKSSDLLANRAYELATELLKVIPHLGVRNAAAHYLASMPDLTKAQAKAFLEAVEKLVLIEQKRSEALALDLESHFRATATLRRRR